MWNISFVMILEHLEFPTPEIGNPEISVLWSASSSLWFLASIQVILLSALSLELIHPSSYNFKLRRQHAHRPCVRLSFTSDEFMQK